jgi:hypothetical protein
MKRGMATQANMSIPDHIRMGSNPSGASISHITDVMVIPRAKDMGKLSRTSTINTVKNSSICMNGIS